MNYIITGGDFVVSDVRETEDGLIIELSRERMKAYPFSDDDKLIEVMTQIEFFRIEQI